MGLGREYKLTIKNYNSLLDKKTYSTLAEAMYALLEILKHQNNLDSYDKGTFIITQNTFNKDLLKKRYRIITIMPYSEIEIKKLSKGSFDVDMFMTNLKRMKEIYFNERV